MRCYCYGNLKLIFGEWCFRVGLIVVRCGEKYNIFLELVYLVFKSICL